MWDGKGKLHATTTAVSKQHVPTIPEMPSLKIERESKTRKIKETTYTIKFCPEPIRQKKLMLVYWNDCMLKQRTVKWCFTESLDHNFYVFM